MKISILSILLFISSFASSQKIAVVELDSIIQHLPDTRIAQVKLDSSISFLQKYQLYIRDSLQTMLKGINHDGPLALEQKLLYQEMVEYAKFRMTSFQQQARDGLEEYRNTLFIPIYKKAKAVCELYAKANGYKAIINKVDTEAALLYGIVDAPDVTAYIILKISQPAKPK